MKRVFIEHIPSGKKWESDWVESEDTVTDCMRVSGSGANVSLSFPHGGLDIFIPPAILNECVRTYEYEEE